MRLAFSGTTVGILGIYVIDSLWAVSRARRRRAAFGMIGGILLLQVGFRNSKEANFRLLTFWAIIVSSIFAEVGFAVPKLRFQMVGLIIVRKPCRLLRLSCRSF